MYGNYGVAAFGSGVRKCLHFSRIDYFTIIDDEVICTGFVVNVLWHAGYTVYAEQEAQQGICRRRVCAEAWKFPTSTSTSAFHGDVKAVNDDVPVFGQGGRINDEQVGLGRQVFEEDEAKLVGGVVVNDHTIEDEEDIDVGYEGVGRINDFIFVEVKPDGSENVAGGV